MSKINSLILSEREETKTRHFAPISKVSLAFFIGAGEINSFGRLRRNKIESDKERLMK